MLKKGKRKEDAEERKEKGRCRRKVSERKMLKKGKKKDDAEER